MPDSSGGPQSALTGPQGAKQTKEPAGVEYVVQRRVVESEPAESESWRDIAKVTVPPRSQTTTIVLAGVKAAGVKPTSADLFRVLDVRAARNLRLLPKEQPEPEYRVQVVDGDSAEELGED